MPCNSDSVLALYSLVFVKSNSPPPFYLYCKYFLGRFDPLLLKVLNCRGELPHGFLRQKNKCLPQ